MLQLGDDLFLLQKDLFFGFYDLPLCLCGLGNEGGVVLHVFGQLCVVIVHLSVNAGGANRLTMK